MSGSFYTLNAKYNTLQSQLDRIISGGGGGVPTSSNLADVLINGNSAGATDIDMNLQSITNATSFVCGDNLNSIDVDGSNATITLTDNLGNTNIITAFGSSVPSANADSVLTTAVSSGGATFYPAFLGATSGYNSVGVSTAFTFNPTSKTETLTDGVNSTTITPTAVSTTTFNGALNGNATSATNATNATNAVNATNATNATKATNLAGGVASEIPYQTGANTTAFIANGTSGQYLKSNGTGVPSWDDLPAPPATPNLQSVLDAGNSATDTNIQLSSTLGFTPTTTLNGTGMGIIDGDDNSASYGINQVLLSNNSGSQTITLTAGNIDPSIQVLKSGGNFYSTLTGDSLKYFNNFTTGSALVEDIVNFTNAGTPDLQQVLSVGSGATSDITLNNTGAGSNYIRLLPNDSATNPAITLTDGTTTNKIDKNGYTTRNTTANLTHYLNFSDNSATGTGAIQKTAGIECNPSTKTITATTFSGALSGNASTATRANTLDITAYTGASATYYPVMVSGAGTGATLYSDSTTAPLLSYNPSTGQLSTTTFSATTGGTIFSSLSNSTLTLQNVPSLTATMTASLLTINQITLNNTASASSDAGRFGQIGLVKLSSNQVAITGSASVQNLSFSSLFNTTYKNYRVILHPTTQVSFTAVYPSYSLQAFLGTSVPTTASLFGFEMVSTASSVVSPVYTSGATISSAPLVFAVSSQPNKEIIFDIQNVGYTATQTQQVSLMCKSIYSNPGVTGTSDRTISATALTNALITGLTIQQSALGVSNNMTLEMVVYGYNNL